jgi:hypothetical protein
MDDLVTWLRAQLDRREGEAKAALRLLDRLTDGEGGYAVRWEWQVFARHPSYSEAGLTVPGAPSPTDVLAEVDAKRRILDLHQPERRRLNLEAEDGNGTVSLGFYVCTTCTPNRTIEQGQDFDEFPCRTVKLLALPMAERDGYRAEWRPQP